MTVPAAGTDPSADQGRQATLASLLALIRPIFRSHWLRLAYGDALHAYPADQLRRILRDAIVDLRGAARSEI